LGTPTLYFPSKRSKYKTWTENLKRKNLADYSDIMGSKPLDLKRFSTSSDKNNFAIKIVCDHCGDSFDDSIAFDRHRFRIKKIDCYYSCNLCTQKFPSICQKMVHLRYFKCSGRTNESASSLAIGPLTNSLLRNSSANNHLAAKSNEVNPFKQDSTNVINPSSTNQLLINSNRPIHTVSASDGQVVRIVRRTSKYDVNRLPPIPKLDIELLNKKSNKNSNS